MRLLVYADLQATDGSELCFTQPNLSLQHYRVNRFFRDIKALYEAQGCDGLVDLGDTTNDRSSIPLPTVEVLGTGLAALPEGRYWKLTGNHEQYLRDTSVNNRRLFDHQFRVVDKRLIQRVENDCTCYFVSYPSDHEELTQWLIREGRRDGPKILFGHFQVAGAYFQSGKALLGVPLNALDPFDLVLLGHIHLPQSLSKTVHYVGSPFQQDWGEAGHTKRVGIVNTKNLTVKWVALTGYPEYRQVSLKEFQTLSQEESEHRYRVTLSSHAESVQFFQHPHFNRATAVYRYDETTLPEANETVDWSFRGICARYMKKVPPSKVGIELTEEEMLEMTESIIQS